MKHVVVLAEVQLAIENKYDFYIKNGGHMDKTPVATILNMNLSEILKLISMTNLYYDMVIVS